MTQATTTRRFGIDFRPLTDSERECFGGASPAALIGGNTDGVTDAPIFIWDPASDELSIFAMDNDEPVEAGFKLIRG